MQSCVSRACSLPVSPSHARTHTQQAKTCSQAPTPAKEQPKDTAVAPPPKITVDDIKKELALLGMCGGANIKSTLVNRLATARGIKFRGCSAPTRKAAGGVGGAGKGEGCAAGPEAGCRVGGGRTAPRNAGASLGLQGPPEKRRAAADDGGNEATKRPRSDSSRLARTQTPSDMMPARGIEAGARGSSASAALAPLGEGNVRVVDSAKFEDWWSLPSDSIFGRVVKRVEEVVDAGFEPAGGEHGERNELDEDEESIYSARCSEGGKSMSSACSELSDFDSEQCRNCGHLFACSANYVGNYPLCHDCR